jgi:hypothetical protein
MKLLSTRMLDGHLGMATLIAPAQAADHTLVVSAYYDRPFLRTLLTAALSGYTATAEVVLHASSGRQLGQQLEDLRRLARGLHVAEGRLRVALIGGMPLFHSKVFAFRRRAEWTVFLGSANATTAALGLANTKGAPRNEEILLELRGREAAPSIIQYLTEISRQAVSIDEFTTPIRKSLPEFAAQPAHTPFASVDVPPLATGIRWSAQSTW